MKIDFSSVLKAGGVAAASAVVLSIVSQIPLFGVILWFRFCIGGLLIPIGAGALYGYFAPGQEDIGESALGGLLAGGTAIIIYGVFQGLSALLFSIFNSSGVVEALATSALTAVFFSVWLRDKWTAFWGYRWDALASDSAASSCFCRKLVSAPKILEQRSHNKYWKDHMQPLLSEFHVMVCLRGGCTIN